MRGGCRVPGRGQDDVVPAISVEITNTNPMGEAARLGVPRVYLGTDIPGYYTRLGASLFAEYPGGYRIMAMDTGA